MNRTPWAPSAFNPLALAILAAGTALAADTEGNLEKSFDVKPGGRLTIHADRGPIELALGGEEKVEVKVYRKVTRAGAKEAEEVLANHQVTFNQQGNEVSVTARNQEDKLLRGFRPPNLEVRYQVMLPRKFSVDLRTAAGKISVPDLSGTVRAQTSGGSVAVGKVQGELWCQTAAGNITVGGANGPADLSTSGGSIKLGDIQGNLKARTAAGNIDLAHGAGLIEARTSGGSINIGEAGADVRAETAAGSIMIRKVAGRLHARTSGGRIVIDEAGGALEASTAAGSITAALTASPEEDCRLETSGGSIQLCLPGAVSAELDAQASGGRVSSELPVTVKGEQRAGSLRGKLGQGGKLLRLRTSAGSIDIKKR